MIVDKIEALDKRRSKVYLDGDFAFVLYKGEIRRYRLSEGENLDESLYEEIMKEVIFRRARERALYFLKSSARTESEVRMKLKQGFYPSPAVEQAIAFLEQYHYLDDEDYAKTYIETHGARKSRQELSQFLSRKGIERQLIKELLEESQPDSQDAIRAILKKKRYYDRPDDLQAKKKLSDYLMRRGFSWDEIRHAMDLSIED